MKLDITIDGRPGALTLDREGETCTFRYRAADGGEREYRASLVEVEPGIYSILTGTRSYEARVVAGAAGYYVDLNGQRSVVTVRDPRAPLGAAHRAARDGRQLVTAPMPGKVVRVLVAQGDTVEAGAGLVVVEAMKMQNELKAPKAGTVVALNAQAGATVALGDVLAAIE